MSFFKFKITRIKYPCKNRMPWIIYPIYSYMILFGILIAQKRNCFIDYIFVFLMIFSLIIFINLKLFLIDKKFINCMIKEVAFNNNCDYIKLWEYLELKKGSFINYFLMRNSKILFFIGKLLEYYALEKKDDCKLEISENMINSALNKDSSIQEFATMNLQNLALMLFYPKR